MKYRGAGIYKQPSRTVLYVIREAFPKMDSSMKQSVSNEYRSIYTDFSGWIILPNTPPPKLVYIHSFETLRHENIHISEYFMKCLT